MARPPKIDLPSRRPPARPKDGPVIRPEIPRSDRPTDPGRTRPAVRKRFRPKSPMSVLPPETARLLVEERRRRSERPTRAEKITPFLVIKMRPEDVGKRPAQGPFNGSIHVEDAATPKAAVDKLIPGHDYFISATVWNLGHAPTIFGLAELYTPNMVELDKLFQAGAPPPMADMIDFTAPQGQPVTFRFRKPFRMEKGDAFRRVSFYVHAYDLVQDPLIEPFAFLGDRHVGRITLGIG